MVSYTFTREERLSGKARYDRVFRGGRAFHSGEVTVLARPNREAVSRLGLSVGRKLGGAVQRNRIKRVLRDAFRLNKALLVKPCDLVVIPRRGWRDVRLGAVAQGFCRILAEISKAYGDEADTGRS